MMPWSIPFDQTYLVTWLRNIVSRLLSALTHSGMAGASKYVRIHTGRGWVKSGLLSGCGPMRVLTVDLDVAVAGGRARDLDRGKPCAGSAVRVT